MVMQIRPVIDATRTSDNRTVIVKKTQTTEEVKVMQYLSEHNRAQDPQNHSVSFVDHFRAGVDEGEEFIVLPVLRLFNDPPFSAVCEVLDFMQQTLEVNL